MFKHMGIHCNETIITKPKIDLGEGLFYSILGLE